MRVAIVHDDLVQWGGAERMLEGICEIFPDSPIFTSVFDRGNKELNKRFGSKKVVTSFLQKIPGWQVMYKILLPLYPIAFEQFDFSDFDVVISQTTRFAKSIITKPETLHICYCHTPPRFLWHLSGEKNYGLVELLLSKLRILDQISASRVDLFLAGSKNAQKRIKKIYQVDSKVLYPFVDLKRFKDVESFDGGYFVTIGRANKYKKLDLVQKVCLDLGVDLKIISGGLDDEMVVRILAGCQALIIAGIEDFGLTSLEAQALGKPVIALGEGGVLETVLDQKTGIFFQDQTVDGLKKAIQELGKIKIDPDLCKQNAAQFSRDKFKGEFKQIVASLVYT